jgi:NTE family protein
LSGLRVNKIGYALGGGGARGLAHIGVLKVLETQGLKPECVAGTSVGALIGALYASGLSALELERLALSLSKRQLTRFLDLTFPFSGLIRGKRVTSVIEHILGEREFTDLSIPFACIATDINTGKEVAIRKGSVSTAIRASISIPGVLTPARIDKQWLVDGGVVNVVPVNVCRKMGANYIFGVNVIPDPAKVMAHLEFIREPSLPFTTAGLRRKTDEKKPPRLIDVMVQTLLISEYRIAMDNCKEADVAITPDLTNIGFWEFHKAAEAIANGEAATWAAIRKTVFLSGKGTKIPYRHKVKNLQRVATHK